MGLPQANDLDKAVEREGLFMLDSGAGGADIMMNFNSGVELNLVDPSRKTRITTTVRVSLLLAACVMEVIGCKSVPAPMLFRFGYDSVGVRNSTRSDPC